MIEFILYGLVLMPFFWLFFVNAITLYNNQDKIPVFIKPIAWIFKAAFLVFDVVFNVVYATIFFLELPREFTLSQRLSRLLITEDAGSFRFKIAYFVCLKLIEPWDPNHCGLDFKIKNE